MKTTSSTIVIQFVTIIAWVGLFFQTNVIVESLSLITNNVRKIQVCQNKDCCQRWNGQVGTLPEALQDLIGTINDIEIETTGCLSQCSKGPNICAITVDGKETFVNGLIDPAATSIGLEVATSDTIIIPTKLLAAVNCLEKAMKGKKDTTDLNSRFYYLF